MNGPASQEFRDPALVDFGADTTGSGRRLERLGGVLVDRPLPQSTARRARPALWTEARAAYRLASTGDGEHRPGRGPRGHWDFTGPLPDPWQVRLPLDGETTLTLEVKPAPSGQTGLFLEQAEQWRWLTRTTPAGGTMLSLFGHSGAATLALAAAGAEVVHVDASRQALALARRNADASGLASKPIRWVCADAPGFVKRQIKRGATFSGAVLDPPSWGHGPDGEAFAIDRDLEPLVADVARLLGGHAGIPRGPILLTCHSAGWHPGRLRDTLSRALRAAGLDGGSFESGPLGCADDLGRTIELGGFARWTPAS
jgi:23S rRNA (cytosine1962-C5)-methyltransferase